MFKTNCLGLCAMLIGSAVFAGGGETVVAFWNFENGLSSGEYTLSERGTAKIVDDVEQGRVLAPAAARSGQPNGVILAKATRPDLMPTGPFSLSMKIKYQLPAASPEKLEYMHLWDTKYATHAGLTLVLARTKENTLNLNVGIGNGEAVESFMVKSVALGDNRWHEIVIKLEADNTLTVAVDGKQLKRFLMSGTPAAAAHRLSIGERVGASYGAFPGLMDDIKLAVPRK